jgi:hypothetical protein
MLFYPAALPLSRHPHRGRRNHPPPPQADRLCLAQAHPRQQALLALADLRKGDSGRRRRLGFGAAPGAVHDLTAARIWGIVRELAASGLRPATRKPATAPHPRHHPVNGHVARVMTSGCCFKMSKPELR